MEYTLTSTLDLKHSDCLIVGILEDEPLSPAVQSLDKHLDGLITRLKKQATGAGNLRIQSDIQGSALVLIHCGSIKTYTPQTLHKHLTTCCKHILSQHYTQVTLAFPALNNHDVNHQLELMLPMMDENFYTQTGFKSSLPENKLEHISLYLPNATESALAAGKAIANAIHYTKQLADLPANVCTPTYLAERAKTLATDHPAINCTIHKQKDIEKLKMGGLLAVAKGSIEPPVFIELHYKGKHAAQSKPMILVGKGITFDAGGISLKPPPNMNEMKYDMCGAATVLGVMQAAAALELPIHLIGLIPSAENMPSGHAVKPGDIITMMSKQTVEVLNTDAEGRLILADALTYAERFNPDFVIDIATLTGAIIVALGSVTNGLMTHDDSLANDILKAGERSLDKTWRMPLLSDYEESLNSPIADMINAGFDRAAGSIIAGLFLSKFTSAYRWAHLDIAGTAWVSGSKRVATGRPVSLLVELLRHASTAG